MNTDDTIFCSPAWWATNGNQLMAERPVKLVRLTSFPDDRVYDDTASRPDPLTWEVRFAAWPGVAFTFPPDGYDPSSWDYERQCPRGQMTGSNS
jgi:hypothetical protein